MKKITYQPKQVRIFLALLLVASFLLTFKLTRHGAASTRWIALAAEAAVIGALAVFPRVFFPAFKLIMIASSRLGSLIFAVLAILVFFLILTPLALAMKIAGKKFMNPETDPSLPSYYVDADAGHDIGKQY
jgi:membrane protein implicated in regulation of membrane protease activity